MPLSKQMEHWDIPHPQLSKIKQLFSPSRSGAEVEIDEEIFSPLASPQLTKKSHPFITTFILLILIGFTAITGWYLGGQSFVLGSKDKQYLSSDAIKRVDDTPLVSSSASALPADNLLLSENEKYQNDEHKINLAVSLAMAIENYTNHYQKTPWENGKITDNFIYSPEKESANHWLAKLNDDQYGLAPSQIEQLKTSNEFYIYKPAGSLNHVFVWVCFYPQSHDYVLAAATKCNRDNRLVPFADDDFNPCQTQDGTVPTTLSKQQNLYCVVNDGTHTLVNENEKDKKSRQKQRDAQRKSDLLTIQQSLIAYYHHHQSYPNGEQYLYRGDHHLTPDYLAILPQPPNYPQENDYIYLPECQVEVDSDTQQEVSTCKQYRLCASQPLEIKGSGNISSNDEQGEWCSNKQKCDYYCLQAADN